MWLSDKASDRFTHLEVPRICMAAMVQKVPHGHVITPQGHTHHLHLYRQVIIHKVDVY